MLVAGSDASAQQSSGTDSLTLTNGQGEIAGEVGDTLYAHAGRTPRAEQPQAKPLDLVPVWTRIGDNEGRMNRERGTASVESAEFSPDGTLVVSGSKGRAYGDSARQGQAVKLWRVDRGVEVWTRPRDDEVEAVAFAPDGRYVAAGGEDSLVEILQVRDEGELLLEPQRVATLQHEAAIDGLRFSPDGRLLVTGAEDQRVRLWRTSDWAHLTTEVHGGSDDDAVNQVDFTTDGRYLATAGTNAEVRLWEVSVEEDASGSIRDARLLPVRTFEHGESAKSVRFSPEDTLLASGASGGAGVKVWRFDGSLAEEIEATGWIMETVAWTPDGRYLLTGGNEGEADDDNGPFSCNYDSETCNGIGAIRAYDTSKDFTRVMTKEVFRQEYLHFSSDGRHLVSSHEDGTLRLWKVSRADRTGSARAR